MVTRNFTLTRSRPYYKTGLTTLAVTFRMRRTGPTNHWQIYSHYHINICLPLWSQLSPMGAQLSQYSVAPPHRRCPAEPPLLAYFTPFSHQDVAVYPYDWHIKEYLLAGQLADLIKHIKIPSSVHIWEYNGQKSGTSSCHSQGEVP